MPFELAVASLITVWALKEGRARPAGVAYQFFDAPSGAFWTRVVEHRLRSLETHLPGFLPGDPTGGR